jgi:hypothetical protein
MAETLEVQCEEEQLFDKDWNDPNCYTVEIFDAKHEQVSVDEIVEPLEHLSPEQKDDLKQVMKHYTKLFSGILGVHPHKKIHIDIMPGAKAKHAGPYAILRIHLAAFKKELDHLRNK